MEQRLSEAARETRFKTHLSLNWVFEYFMVMFISEKYQSMCPKWQFWLQIAGTLEKNSVLNFRTEVY